MEHKIRWKKQEQESLKRRMASYNAKIRRLEKKGYDKALLPEKMSFKSIKKIESRKQLKETLQLIDVFTKRGSEKREIKTTRGAIIPEFVMKQSKIKLKAINRRRAELKKRYENLPATDRNKKLGLKAKNMQGIEASHIYARQFNYQNMSKKELEIFLETLSEYDEDKEKKDALYRENFYRALKKEFTEEEYNNLVRVIDKVDTQTMVDKYYTDLNMDIDFTYEKTDREIKYNEILNSWNSVLRQQKQKNNKSKKTKKKK